MYFTSIKDLKQKVEKYRPKNLHHFHPTRAQASPYPPPSIYNPKGGSTLLTGLLS